MRLPRPAVAVAITLRGLMSPPDAPRIAVAPESAPSWVSEAVHEGGGYVVSLAEAEGVIWSDPRDAAGLARRSSQAAQARWVQLPFAGIENFVHLLDDETVWACGKGVYAEPVAELALTLGLAGLRGLATYSRAQSWEPPQGRNLLGGSGHDPRRRWDHDVAGPPAAAVRLSHHRRSSARRGSAGVDDVLDADRYADALPGADLVVIALALTPDTEGLIAADELALMEDHAWLVNVARGRHVVTDDLVVALARRCHRWRWTRRHRSRAAATGPPAVDDAQLHHHAARRQHPGDGDPVAVGADHHQRPPLRRRRRAHRPRRHRSRLLAGRVARRIRRPHSVGSSATTRSSGSPRRHRPRRSAAPIGSWPASTTLTTTRRGAARWPRVNEAYRVLRHPGRRAAYDAELAARAERRATPRRTAYPPAQGAARRASTTAARRATHGSSSSAAPSSAAPWSSAPPP